MLNAESDAMRASSSVVGRAAKLALVRTKTSQRAPF